MKTFDKGSIPKTGADILQNWHHIRTQSVDINELSEIASPPPKEFLRDFRGKEKTF